MIDILIILLLCFLLLISAFFSAAETAYSNINKFTLEKLKNKNNLSYKLIKKHYQSFGWTLSTILIGNNLVNVALSTIITFLLSEKFGNNSSLIIIFSLLIATPIIIIFGEVIPKLFAKKYSYIYLVKVVFLMEFFHWIFIPFTWPFIRLITFYKTNISEQDVKDITKISLKQRGIKTEEAWYISKVLELNDSEISKIMVPKKLIVSLNENTTIDNALKIFYKSGHSRLPILKKKKFIGIILLKDLIQNKKGDQLKNYLIKVPHISSWIKIPSTFEKLRSKKAHMAFIENSNDKIIGLVTIEDIIEEIFGEIYDEHDKTSSILQISTNKWLVNGNIFLSELKSLFPNIVFEKIDRQKNPTIKQWVQHQSNNKLKLNYRYIYKNELIFLIVKNTKKETKFEIIKKFK